MTGYDNEAAAPHLSSILLSRTEWQPKLTGSVSAVTPRLILEPTCPGRRYRSMRIVSGSELQSGKQHLTRSLFASFPCSQSIVISLQLENLLLAHGVHSLPV